MADRKTDREPAHSVPEYAGAVSRFLDLADHPVAVEPGQDKTAAEFEAFNRYLDRLAQEKRRIETLEF
jgi:hypothetical protein